MATIVATKFKVHSPVYKISKHNNNKQKSKLRLHLRCASTTSSYSDRSDVPSYENKLTSECLTMFDRLNSSVPTTNQTVEKFQRTFAWVQVPTQVPLDYSNHYNLIFNDAHTSQHVENISYVYNIERFTSNLNNLEEELLAGDDCEQFYYNKHFKPSTNYTYDPAASPNKEVDFDPTLFEEAVSFNNDILKPSSWSDGEFTTL